MGASPAVSDGNAYFGTFENRVFGVDLESFEVSWVYQHPKRHFPFYSSAAVTEDLVLVGGRDKMLHAIGRLSGKSAWTFSTGARVEASPVVVGNRVVFGSGDGMLHILELGSGESVWRFDTGSSIISSPSVAAERIVISTEDGLVYCFASD
jgi:outer membrane protein assembly factor BamB